MTVIDPATDRRAATLEPTLQWVLTRVRLRSQRRIAWLRHLWEREGQSGGRFAVTHDEVDAILSDWDHPSAEAAWYASTDALQPINVQLTEVEQALDSHSHSRLTLLQHIFGLSSAEMDVVHACLAIALDPALSRVFAYLQDYAGRGYVTYLLVARLFEHGQNYVIHADSPLHRWQLITETEVAPGEPVLLACDPLVQNWLLGYHDLDSQLIGIAQLQPALPPLPSWSVTKTVAHLQTLLNQNDSLRVQLQIVGTGGSGRRTFAAQVCQQLGLLLLTLDADAVDDTHWAEVWLRSQRQAFLDRCALAWYGDSLARHSWQGAIAPFPLQIMIAEPGQPIPVPSGVVPYRVEMPSLSLAERRHLWQQFVPTAQEWDEASLEALVTQHAVTVGEIAAIARHPLRLPNDAAMLIRESSRHRLGKLAQALDCPFTWEDLVISDAVRDTLADFVFEAQTRAAFWEAPNACRLFPQGRSLIALFSGAPGTGKTMAAQVMAASLALDLVRVDLSSVVSKYVGETSQNLERILAQAAQMDVVLLFDEADALFGKRTEIKDAHDRFANTDTNYLLQAIENYTGIVILATNRKSNVDAAFLRRLRYVLEFSKPDVEQRYTIWCRIIQELVGEPSLDSLRSDLQHLSQSLELTGAQIKFSVLAGIFAANREAQPFSMPYLLRGLERELNKEGRTLSDRERARLIHHGR